MQEQAAVSDNTVDVRTKLSPEYHQALSVIAQATDQEISEILRVLIHSFVDQRVHEARVILGVIGGEGTVGKGREPVEIGTFRPGRR